MSGHNATLPYGGRHTTKTCRLDGCNRVHAAKGFCVKHYKRVWRHGSTKSKGKKPEGVSARNSLIKRYRLRARSKGLTWELGGVHLEVLFQSECFYCGRPPENVSSRKDGNGSFIYQGIDRVDNDRGYTITNVVPCCKWCNYAKGEMSLSGFIDQACKVAERTIRT